MTKSFNAKLIEIFKTDSCFVDDEGELVKAAVIDREIVNRSFYEEAYDG